MTEETMQARDRLRNALMGARIRLQAIETQVDARGREEWLAAMEKAVEQCSAIMDLAAATAVEREKQQVDTSKS